MNNKVIYLDNNATTPLDPAALDVMVGELSGSPHNPSSIHCLGQEGRRRLSDAREQIARFLGVKPNELLFTSGGTEGMNLLLRGLLTTSQPHIITSEIEHACLYETVRELTSKGGEVTYLPVDAYGAPRPAALERALRRPTHLIALSAANGETGVKLEWERIGAIAQRAHVPLILDGVALLGKEPFTIPEGVSGMAFSAHKCHGPKGVGAVFVRKGVKLRPLLTGGGQEKGLRSGTENLPAILGMAAALEQFKADVTLPYLRGLRERFELNLLEALPNIEVNGEGPRLPHTSNLYFPGVDGESLLIALDMEQIAASHASACASLALQPSRTLRGMGYSQERASSSLRFSFSRFNTVEEVERASEVITLLVKNLQKHTKLYI